MGPVRNRRTPGVCEMAILSLPSLADYVSSMSPRVWPVVRRKSIVRIVVVHVHLHDGHWWVMVRSPALDTM